ncbi:hypothetical protein ACT3N0_06565 [Citrobacter portucalensis]|uniref:hypothetical protein n=1 Tax=Citrobacter portucalensis TaxID=1639133 RepID=UPI003B244BC3
MTTNHPANGPVSLDRLHQISEILSKAAAQSDGGNLGYAMADAVKVIDEVLERLKADSAEPIYQYRIRNGYNGQVTEWQTIRRDQVDFVLKAQPLNAEFRIISAPHPALVVQDERAAFNAWNNEDNLPIAGVGAKNAAWLAWQARAAMLQAGNSPVTPDGYALVPIVPTEDMIINGFESVPDPHFSDEKEWEEYEALSGCRQAARRAELCWAAMIKAAPKQENI